MTVRIWFRDALQTEDIKGDLAGVTNTFNIAKAKGFAYAILEDSDGLGLMVEMGNIVKAREVDESKDHAFLGG